MSGFFFARNYIVSWFNPLLLQSMLIWQVPYIRFVIHLLVKFKKKEKTNILNSVTVSTGGM